MVPSDKLIAQARQKNLALLDSLRYDVKKTDWSYVAKNFVYSKKFNRNNRRMQIFIKTMHSAKVQTERKMRAELDVKVAAMPIDKLQKVLGLSMADKAKTYTKQYKQLVTDKLPSLDIFQDEINYDSDDSASSTSEMPWPVQNT